MSSKSLRKIANFMVVPETSGVGDSAGDKEKIKVYFVAATSSKITTMMIGQFVYFRASQALASTREKRNPKNWSIFRAVVSSMCLEYVDVSSKERAVFIGRETTGVKL